MRSTDRNPAARNIRVIALLAIVTMIVFATSRRTLAEITDWLFADSFESGSLMAWSASNSTGSTSLDVVFDAAFEGLYGLRTTLGATGIAYVESSLFGSESVYWSEFMLDADQLVMTTGAAIDIVVASDDVFTLSLVKELDGLRIQLEAKENSGSIVASPLVDISEPGWHWVAVSYGAGTQMNGLGEARLFIDGTLAVELVDIDNDTRQVDWVRLGLPNGAGAGSSGSWDLDSFIAIRSLNPWPCLDTPDDVTCLDREGPATAVDTSNCPTAVIVWEGRQESTPTESRVGGIYGSHVSGEGLLVGSIFAVNQDPVGGTPDVGLDDSCNSVVTWSGTEAADGIFFSRFDEDGVLQTGPLSISSAGDSETLPVVGADSLGGFVAAWSRETGGDTSVWARFYDQDSLPLGAAVQLDAGTGDSSPPSADMNGAGRSIVVWESAGQVFGQTFDPGGVPAGSHLIAVGPKDREPAVAVTASGGFVATWARGDEPRDVYFGRFDSSGLPIGPEVLVSPSAASDDRGPDIAVDDWGSIVVVWISSIGMDVTLQARVFTPAGVAATDPYDLVSSGLVWDPTTARVAASTRSFFGYLGQSEPDGWVPFKAEGAFLTVRANPIFTDGFESGNMTKWSDTNP